MGLIRDAREIYTEEGVTSLLFAAIRHIRYHLFLFVLNRCSLDRRELISYCDSAESVLFYGDEERFEIREPLTAELPTEYQSLVGPTVSSPNFVCELSDAKLIGPYAIPQTASGRIVLEPMGKINMLQSRLERTFEECGTFTTIRHLLSTVLPTGTDADYDLAVSLVPRHGKNVDHCSYGHWIAEDLPRLRGIEQYCEATDTEPVFLIKPNAPSWMRDTLELLGYDSDDMIEWDQDVATVDRLIVPTLRYLHTTDYDPYPSDKRWLRDQVLGNIPDVDTEFSEYVLLSRQGTNRRRISNYDEVLDVLEPYGFESYRMENLSIPEQIQLCANANVIIGANGSNMINAVWAEDATIVALYPPCWFGIDSYMIANERGLAYDFIIGDHAPGDDEDLKDYEEDIVVDTETLRDIIQQVV